MFYLNVDYFDCFIIFKTKNNLSIIILQLTGDDQRNIVTKYSNVQNNKKIPKYSTNTDPKPKATRNCQKKENCPLPSAW
jgi:hypothetical protein